MEIGNIFYFYFYFWPEEPAAPVLTSPADSLRDSRYGPRRGRTQQAGAAPHGLGADAPQEDHYSGLAAPPSEMCRRKIGDDAAVAPQALRARNMRVAHSFMTGLI